MGLIKRLPESVVNKIAAGEVVERPASVVKELVENAIDAGATDISIEVRKGGKSLVRVRDNGCGMGREDMLLALERHSTSKIDEASDLFRIRTLGFRGEALPSIAAVSRLSVATKGKGPLAGSRVTVIGGKIEDVRETGVPEGTEVVVSDLFFNAPVRRRFLRTNRTENSAITAFVTKQALARHAIGFSLVADGEEVIKSPPARDALERIAALFGADIVNELIPVEAREGSLALNGFISTPGMTRGNRTGHYFLVNGRPVQDKILSYAVSEAYGGLLPARRHAIVFLSLDCDPGQVDVNVHPSKREVRFQNVNRVRDFVRGALASVLGNADLSRDMRVAGSERVIGEDTGAYVTRREGDSIERIPGPGVAQESLPWEEGGDAGLEAGRRSLRPIGQIKNLYVLCEAPEGLAIIDQHAAHERILFEKMMRLYREGGKELQELLIPQVVTLPASEFLLARDCIGIFRALGIRVEGFGKNALKIESVPAFLENVDPGQLVRDVAGALAEGGRITAVDEELVEAVAKKVCRAAVKKRDLLREEECRRLVRDLLICENPYSCPHGRPTVIKISTEELDRKFGRT